MMMMKSEAIFSITRLWRQTDQHISKSKTETIIFVFAVTVSCLMLVYLTYEATDRFISSPTTIEESTEELHEFPTVSVFLHNIIDVSRVESVGLTKLHIKYLLTQIRQPTWELTREDEQEFKDNNLSALAVDINEVCRAHNLTRPELLEFVKYNRDALIEACETARIEYRVNRLQLTMARKWQYNGSETTAARSPLLYFWFKELAEENPYIKNHLMLGISYVIEVDNIDDFKMNTAIDIKPNFVNYVSLTPERISLLDRSTRSCRQTGGFYGNCTNNCWLQALECHYDCKWWSREWEGLEEQNFCRYQWFQKSSKSSCKRNLDLCDEKCIVPPCEYWRYNNHIYHVNAMSSNLTRVEIALSSGWRTTLHEEKYTITWIDYASNVAGLVGLFFGGSMITLICFCSSCLSRSLAKEIVKPKKYTIRQTQNTDGLNAVTHM